MKVAIVSGVVCGVVGFLFGNLDQSPEQEEQRKHDDASPRNRTVANRGGSAHGVGGIEISRSRVIAERNEEILGTLQSSNPEEVIRVVREILEDEHNVGVRISLVCDALALMTEENADSMKAAFDQSWAEGFNYDWERQLFVDRYGEIVGLRAVEEYPTGMYRHRAVSGWARTNPDEAIDWVNQLEEGSAKSHSIGSIMWSLSNEKPEYTLQVFRAFPQEEQVNRIGELVKLTRRQGGSQAAAELAENLRTSESVEDQVLARGAYYSTFKAFQEGAPEKMEEWLGQLPKEALLLIGPRLLPEKYAEKLSN